MVVEHGTAAEGRRRDNAARPCHHKMASSVNGRQTKETTGTARPLTADEISAMRVPADGRIDDATLFAVGVLPVTTESWMPHNGTGGASEWVAADKYDVIYASADGTRTLLVRHGQLTDARRGLNDYDADLAESGDDAPDIALQVLDDVWPDELVEVNQ